MFDILNNKRAFLQTKPRKFGFTILTFVFFSLLIYGTYKIQVYDNYQTKGYITCESECFLVVSIPSNISFEKITVNNKELSYSLIEEVLEIDEVNLISFKKLTLTIKGYQDKEIVDVNFYYNKQRILTKIKEKMF